MAETTETKTGGKLDGIAVGGRVIAKNHYPARTTDKGVALKESFRVDLAYVGGTAPVEVSQARFERIAVDSYQMFLVMQRSGKNGVIYNTAIDQ